MNISVITKATSAFIFTLFAALAMYAILLTLPARAQESQVTAAQEVTETNTAVPESYVFVAQPGDSYTKMARKAVQIYGIQTNTNLSPEQIVYAETGITQAAGSPQLEIGQTVTTNSSVVKEWIEKAKALSEAEKSQWSYFVTFVDFNTNNVGQ